MGLSFWLTTRLRLLFWHLIAIHAMFANAIGI
jgi:hypothetical protein